MRLSLHRVRGAQPMNAQTETIAEPAFGSEATYAFSFGIHNQTTPWTDVRSLTWSELARLLTSHSYGAKEGTCIVPAVFSGTRRKKAEAVQIDTAFLDSDAGHTRAEIVAALERLAVAAIVSSTHSHLTTLTSVKASHWTAFVQEFGDNDRTATAYLEQRKGYQPEIAAGASVHSAVGDYIILGHQPCPKFRIAVKLLRPWRAADYPDQDAANEAWGERLDALAAALGLDCDESCTDTSRLFYLPRRTVGGAEPETAILEGAPCDIFALPKAPKRTQPGPEGLDLGDEEHPNFADPETGEILQFRSWAAEFGTRFQIAVALRARRADIFVGKVADGTRHHIRCPNEDQHTEPGEDQATFVMNASDSQTKGFVVHCMHRHCEKRDRLHMLRRMLQQGWLKVADVTNAQFLCDEPGGGLPADAELTEHGVALVFAHRFQDRLRFCHTSARWHIWNGAHWRQDKTKLALDWARRLAASLNRQKDFKTRAVTGKASFASAVEKLAQADEALAVTSDIWDREPFPLCTPGGVVDLRTGEIRPARPDDFMTRITAVAPAAIADCPRWRQFMLEVTGGDEDTVRFLQQWFGYTLTGDTREEALLFVHGPGGNGKSKLLSTVQGILGSYCRTAAMETFTASPNGDRHPTELAMLAGARMVCASETEEGRPWAEVRIKQMTGNDVISARFMHQNFFEYRPQFKLTIIGNHKPTLRNVDDSARRRFNIVPFRFKPNPKDPQLEAKLRAEWPGILRWMIEGCLDWQQHGLVRPSLVQQETQEYFATQDYFGRWLAECCILDAALSTKPSALLSSFQQWCQANGEEATDNRRLRGMIERTEGLRYVTVKGSQLVRGIGLHADASRRWGGGVEDG